MTLRTIECLEIELKTISPNGAIVVTNTSV